MYKPPELDNVDYDYWSAMISNSRCLCRPLVWLHGRVHQCTQESSGEKPRTLPPLRSWRGYSAVQSRPSLVLREKSLGIEKSGMMGGGSGSDNGATTRRQPSGATPYSRRATCHCRGQHVNRWVERTKDLGSLKTRKHRKQYLGFEQTSNSNRIKATNHEMFFYIINKHINRDKL